MPSPDELSRPGGARARSGGDTSALLLLLLDSRAPAGGPNHSGGMEAAVETGMVRDLADVESFCRARLRTAGRVAAAFAAAGCDMWPGSAGDW
ncbi:MAG TPA: hypothetical protein VFU35_11065, partial [Jatrophihabitans sp.]|nr:hypothetical protein [Jatrophihabitans sp.]